MFTGMINILNNLVGGDVHIWISGTGKPFTGIIDRIDKGILWLVGEEGVTFLILHEIVGVRVDRKEGEEDDYEKTIQEVS